MILRFLNTRVDYFSGGCSQLVLTGRFVMPAPLQLVDFFEKDGLVIRPVLQRMHVREAGIHVRKSSLEYGAIKASLAYFDTILDK